MEKETKVVHVTGTVGGTVIDLTLAYDFGAFIKSVISTVGDSATLFSNLEKSLKVKDKER